MIFIQLHILIQKDTKRDYKEIYFSYTGRDIYDVMKTTNIIELETRIQTK